MKILSDSTYKHRVGTTTVKLTGCDGAPLANKPAVVKQVKHEFLFGCSAFTALQFVNNELSGEAKEITEKRFEKMFELLNFATMPFYWGRFEPVKGQPDTQRVKQASQWLKGKGMELKGHPLCWHTGTAPWLMEMSNEEILAIQLERIDRDVKEFKGLIDIWDVINEVVIMPIFNKYDNGITRICKELGRIRLVREVFAYARKANPDATLLINDFETSEAYDILVEGLLEAGVPIDAIGIQSHMHQGYWGVEKTQEILDRFSRFHLPIHFTENSLVSGDIMPAHIVDLNDFKVESWPSTPEGEERQAEEAALHYKTLFEHPLVKSVTWWNIEDGHWLGAPSGFITQDGRAKPIYDRLHGLIKGEWWMQEETLITDENGNITVSGTLGEYTAVCNGVESGFTIRSNA